MGMKIQNVKNMAIGIGIMILLPLLTNVGTQLVIKKPSFVSYTYSGDSTEHKEARDKYELENNRFATNYFYIASSVGIVSIIIGVIAPAALGMGFVLGGVFSLVLGYVAAWDVLSDLFKFITLLVALILLVLGSFKMIKLDK